MGNTRTLVRAGLAGVILAAAGCPPPPKKPTGGTIVTVDGEVPPLPGDFTPGPPLEEPLPPDPGAFGLAYLERIHPALKGPWRQFLEDARLRLPPDHPLNSPTLAAKVELVIDLHGGIADVKVIDPSGNADFDAAAEEIARDAGPLPAPPPELLSDDDHVYVTWLFARDRRQAGVATAELRRVEWPIERAVPRLVDRGDLAEAARRLHAAAAAAPSKIDPKSPEAAQLTALTSRVMIAALREGLRDPDPAVQRLAVDGVVAAARVEALAPAARELRSIADGSVELPLRAAAVDALAAIGDREAAPMLREILVKDQGGNPALSAAAARALVALGAADAAAEVLGGWLASGDRAKLGGALATLARAAVPGTAAAVAPHVDDQDVGIRIAACGALGAAAGEGKDASAWKPLRRGLDDRDASVRAACARAAAAAAGAGAKNKLAYWRLLELAKDRDERVRAGAVLGALRMEPDKTAKGLPLAREKSPVVLAALATGLADVPGATPKKLTALAGHADAGVRAVAVAALAARKDAASRQLAAAAIVDPELPVRLAALEAIDDPAQLEALAGDATPEVAAAARARRITLLGRWGGLVEVTAGLGAGPPVSERVLLATAWLQAT